MFSRSLMSVIEFSLCIQALVVVQRAASLAERNWTKAFLHVHQARLTSNLHTIILSEKTPTWRRRLATFVPTNTWWELGCSTAGDIPLTLQSLGNCRSLPRGLAVCWPPTTPSTTSWKMKVHHACCIPLQPRSGRYMALHSRILRVPQNLRLRMIQ